MVEIYDLFIVNHFSAIFSLQKVPQNFVATWCNFVQTHGIFLKSVLLQQGLEYATKPLCRPPRICSSTPQFCLSCFSKCLVSQHRRKAVCLLTEGLSVILVVFGTACLSSVAFFLRFLDMKLIPSVTPEGEVVSFSRVAYYFFSSSFLVWCLSL